MSTSAHGLRDEPIVLGPLLRMVTTSTASVWVQTARGGVVTVRAAERRWSAPTFRVLEFHYALVVCDGLEPGTSVEYEVLLDDERVWPQPDSDLPPPRLSTLDPDRPLRLAFGSCRTSVPHDAAGNASNGVDALRAYALDALTKDRDEWPTMIAFLGDRCTPTRPPMRCGSSSTSVAAWTSRPGRS